MKASEKFAVLKAGRRVWAVASIHGEAARLRQIHEALAERFMPGDRLAYLGNYLGRGGQIRETVDELLRFRRILIAAPRMFASDVAYLRGGQEEMWQKLLQLQFAPNPREVLGWMLQNGVEATLMAYGGDPQQAAAAARDGAVSITRWTNQMRNAMQASPGHYALMSALRRAAYTADETLLFVSAGIDPERPLTAQADALWWGSSAFVRMEQPYGGFRRVVRGYDRGHGGLKIDSFTATVDGGAGFGGPLLAGCFDHSGELVDMIEA